jgi:hypothetical protein
MRSVTATLGVGLTPRVSPRLHPIPAPSRRAPSPVKTKKSSSYAGYCNVSKDTNVLERVMNMSGILPRSRRFHEAIGCTSREAIRTPDELQHTSLEHLSSCGPFAALLTLNGGSTVGTSGPDTVKVTCHVPRYRVYLFPLPAPVWTIRRR